MTYVPSALEADSVQITPTGPADRVHAYRAGLIRGGYYPLAIPRGAKHPIYEGWQQVEPTPPAMHADPEWDVTGIHTRGLRAVDCDIDDPDLHDEVVALAREVLGESPIRYRTTSHRLLLLYRASEGEPGKLALTGAHHTSEQSCRIEVLGRGQQCVVDGVHPSGGVYGWVDGEPGEAMPLTSLPTITEAQVGAFLDAAAEIMGVEAPSIRNARIEREWAERASDIQHAPMTLEDVEAALAVIPYDGYDQWVALASACAAANPSSLHLFEAWFQRGGSNKSVAEARERFLHPLRKIGAGTLIHMAREAQPGWVSPSVANAPRVDEREAALRERLAALRDRTGANASSQLDDGVDHKTKRYRMFSPVRLSNLPPVKWLIPGLLPCEYFATCYGASRAFKSFLALDMALSISTGVPFHGRQVERAPVVYIAPEGFSGLNNRIEAWLRDRKIDRADTDFWAIGEGVNLMLKTDILDLVSDFVAMGMRPALVVFDTLARSMNGGDEQAAKDFNIVTANANLLRQMIGCSVMLVHHAGKDASRGARGSYAIKANSDAMFEVTRDGDSLTTSLRVEKLKDARDDFSIEFDGKTVEWIDERHGPQSSLVFVEKSPEPRARFHAVIDARDRQKLVDALEPGKFMSMSEARAILGVQKSGTAHERIRRLVPEEGVEVGNVTLLRVGTMITIR